MDGPWQIGHMTATAYGMKARDTARQMRYVDKSVQLIARGQAARLCQPIWSGTAKSWTGYDLVDGLSLHRYLREQ